ncbi:hypothetical protein SISSUDRAFT_1009334 [Sistotremastrum suecicum HHB10207 ss-3]|uniref:Uncharacterized protein n=1 Tax=Sistotremastrum suecicum HHB10207 ss-3 TaxID=1314776 RepID=A0A166A3C6_9AGAM|nr:hypothetical protein SISSUDRAFT_1009334 [Sistotremastrum suecicum HHB10207 ss-3]
MRLFDVLPLPPSFPLSLSFFPVLSLSLSIHSFTPCVQRFLHSSIRFSALLQHSLFSPFLRSSFFAFAHYTLIFSSYSSPSTLIYGAGLSA